VTDQAIPFGTAGWRGIIAKDFTFSRVRRAAAAIAGHVLAKKQSPELIVGYDTRFFSLEFALAAAEVLRSKGCRVRICGEPTPRPTISHAILHGKLDGGVNITGGHHPAQYNGLKFSGPDGGPALAEVSKDLEKRAATLQDGPVPRHQVEANFEQISPREPYFEQLRKTVRFQALAKTRGTFVCDAVHGSGAGWLDRVLADSGIAVTPIRANRDVLFAGSAPDPSEQNLAPLRNAVVEHKALAGLATDGDAGRFGIVDQDGSFVSPNHILGLVFDYLLQTRAEKRGASRSVATTHLLDAVARLHDVKIYETPVGFEYVGPLLRERKIALAGEESGGMAMPGHLPEADGILACLLVAEMIAQRQATITEQLRDLFGRVGREFWPVRVNQHLSEEVQAKLPQRWQEDFKEFAGRQVAHTERTDGLKLILGDDTWLLMRPSKTEPVVRIYSEAATLAESQRLANQARKWVLQ